MARGFRIAAAAALVAALVSGVPAAGSAAPAPRWVLHAERFPGGLSQGVRAYALRPALASPATSAPVSRPEGPALGPLDNVKMNADSNPPVPQDETAVADEPSHPTTAVAAANGYVNDGLWIGRTTNGGHSWSSLFKAPRVRGTGAHCNGSDPSVAYSRRDAAFYVSTLCFAGSISEIDVWKSVDGGAHWTPSLRAARVVSNRRSNGRANSSKVSERTMTGV